MTIALMLIACVQMVLILYLIRLHFGLRRDSQIRYKNWLEISKAIKDHTERIYNLERRR